MDEKQKTEAVSNVKSIKQYFESGTHGRKVDLQELRKMTPEDRAELGGMCREALEKGWD